MTGKQRSTGGTVGFYLPAIWGLLRNVQTKLAAFLPPPGNISQTCYPNWQWLIMGRSEEGVQRLLAENGTLWMKIEHIDSTEVVDMLHDITPDTSNLFYIIDTETIKKRLDVSGVISCSMSTT